MSRPFDPRIAFPVDDEQDAADGLLDAAFICGTMDSDSVYDHYNAADFLRWHAARYAEAVTGEPSYHEWDHYV